MSHRVNERKRFESQNKSAQVNRGRPQSQSRNTQLQIIDSKLIEVRLKSFSEAMRTAASIQGNVFAYALLLNFFYAGIFNTYAYNPDLTRTTRPGRPQKNHDHERPDTPSGSTTKGHELFYQAQQLQQEGQLVEAWHIYRQAAIQEKHVEAQAQALLIGEQFLNPLDVSLQNEIYSDIQPSPQGKGNSQTAKGLRQAAEKGSVIAASRLGEGILDAGYPFRASKRKKFWAAERAFNLAIRNLAKVNPLELSPLVREASFAARFYLIEMHVLGVAKNPNFNKAQDDYHQLLEKHQHPLADELTAEQIAWLGKLIRARKLGSDQWAKTLDVYLRELLQSPSAAKADITLTLQAWKISHQPKVYTHVGLDDWFDASGTLKASVTPMTFIAAANGHVKVLAELLKRDFDYRERHLGQTIYDIAITHAQHDCAKFILEISNGDPRGEIINELKEPVLPSLTANEINTIVNSKAFQNFNTPYDFQQIFDKLLHGGALTNHEINSLYKLFTILVFEPQAYDSALPLLKVTKACGHVMAHAAVLAIDSAIHYDDHIINLTLGERLGKDVILNAAENKDFAKYAAKLARYYAKQGDRSQAELIYKILFLNGGPYAHEALLELQKLTMSIGHSTAAHWVNLCNTLVRTANGKMPISEAQQRFGSALLFDALFDSHANRQGPPLAEVQLSDFEVALIAVIQDDYKTLSNLLANTAFAIDNVNNQGLTLLSKAVSRGNYKMVEYLLQRGANPEGRDPNNLNTLKAETNGYVYEIPPAIIYAVGDIRMLKILLRYGADPWVRVDGKFFFDFISEETVRQYLLAEMQNNPYRTLIPNLSKDPKPVTQKMIELLNTNYKNTLLATLPANFVDDYHLSHEVLNVLKRGEQPDPDKIFRMGKMGITNIPYEIFSNTTALEEFKIFLSKKQGAIDFSLSWLTIAASHGHVKAICSLGKIHFAQDNIELALKYLKNAAHAGKDPEAALCLALGFAHGKFGGIDEHAAERYFEQTLMFDSTNHVALRSLAILHLQGRTNNPSRKMAKKLIQRALTILSAGEAADTVGRRELGDLLQKIEAGTPFPRTQPTRSQIWLKWLITPLAGMAMVAVGLRKFIFPSTRTMAHMRDQLTQILDGFIDCEINLTDNCIKVIPRINDQGFIIFRVDDEERKLTKGDFLKTLHSLLTVGYLNSHIRIQHGSISLQGYSILSFSIQQARTNLNDALTKIRPIIDYQPTAAFIATALPSPNNAQQTTKKAPARPINSANTITKVRKTKKKSKTPKNKQAKWASKRAKKALEKKQQELADYLNNCQEKLNDDEAKLKRLKTLAQQQEHTEEESKELLTHKRILPSIEKRLTKLSADLQETITETAEIKGLSTADLQTLQQRCEALITLCQSYDQHDQNTEDDNSASREIERSEPAKIEVVLGGNIVQWRKQLPDIFEHKSEAYLNDQQVSELVCQYTLEIINLKQDREEKNTASLLHDLNLLRYLIKLFELLRRYPQEQANIIGFSTQELEQFGHLLIHRGPLLLHQLIVSPEKIDVTVIWRFAREFCLYFGKDLTDEPVNVNSSANTKPISLCDTDFYETLIDLKGNHSQLQDRDFRTLFITLLDKLVAQMPVKNIEDIAEPPLLYAIELDANKYHRGCCIAIIDCIGEFWRQLLHKKATPAQKNQLKGLRKAISNARQIDDYATIQREKAGIMQVYHQVSDQIKNENSDFYSEEMCHLLQKMMLVRNNDRHQGATIWPITPRELFKFINYAADICQTIKAKMNVKKDKRQPRRHRR